MIFFEDLLLGFSAGIYFTRKAIRWIRKRLMIRDIDRWRQEVENMRARARAAGPSDWATQAAADCAEVELWKRSPARTKIGPPPLERRRPLELYDEDRYR